LAAVIVTFLTFLNRTFPQEVELSFEFKLGPSEPLQGG
jgi:hypothetical protein